MKKLLLVLAILIIIGAGAFVWMNQSKFGLKPERQAVFLTNGQVYFGYVSHKNSQIVTIRDVYYLKTAELQQAGADKKILLVRMGNEMHSPETSMQVNRDQILFYQSLRDESKINEAISKFSSTAKN